MSSLFIRICWAPHPPYSSWAKKCIAHASVFKCCKVTKSAIVLQIFSYPHCFTSNVIVEFVCNYKEKTAHVHCTVQYSTYCFKYFFLFKCMHDEYINLSFLQPSLNIMHHNCNPQSAYSFINCNLSSSQIPLYFLFYWNSCSRLFLWPRNFQNKN